MPIIKFENIEARSDIANRECTETRVSSLILPTVKLHPTAVAELSILNHFCSTTLAKNHATDNNESHNEKKGRHWRENGGNGGNSQALMPSAHPG